MLTLTFLGVGSAFAKRNMHSNALLEAWSGDPATQVAPDDNLLIDFGGTGPLAMHRLKDCDGFGYLNVNGTINYPAIQNILTTHLHADHIGGLEELATVNRHNFGLHESPEKRLPRIISSAEVLDHLWSRSLRGGLGVSRGSAASLNDFFRATPVAEPFDGTTAHVTLLDRYDIHMVRTDHIRIRDRYDWPTFGLRLVDRVSGASVYYSGDTRFDPDRTLPMMHEARLVFHDAQLSDEADPVHALLSELRTLPVEIKQKMRLYHYADFWDCGDYGFVDEEFAGFAMPALRYTLFGNT